MTHPHPLPTWHIATTRVTYRMTDQMGVVYYSNYFEFFEIGRNEMLRSTGLTYCDMETDGFFLPVVHAACDYATPARYDDVLEIRTAFSRLTRVRLNFVYEIVRVSDGTSLVRGATHHAIVDREGRPRRLTPEWHDRLQTLAHPAQDLKK